jgi:hypothetical protein
VYRNPAIDKRVYADAAEFCAQEDDDLAGIGGGGKKTKFSRLAWGLEIWDLICIAVDLMYEPELQVSRITADSSQFVCPVHRCRGTSSDLSPLSS